MSSSTSRRAVLAAPTTAFVTICAGSSVSRPKTSQQAFRATASQVAVGDMPRVRRCRQESQSCGQTRAMVRVDARTPRAADMVERRSDREELRGGGAIARTIRTAARHARR
nr:hypothetical protein [Blastococcus saxobsidens]